MAQNPEIKEKNWIARNPVTFLENKVVDSFSFGVTAMLLAYKLEEVSVPILEDSVLISYAMQEVLDMEKSVGNKLRFKFAVPTPQLDKENLKQLELCLWVYEMLDFPPSQLSAAAVYPAPCSLSRTCEWYTNYSEDELQECSRIKISFHKKAERRRLTGVHRNKTSEGYTTYSEDGLQSFLVELEFPQYLGSAASIYPAHCSLSRFKQWSKTCQWYTNNSEDEFREYSRMSFHQKAETGRLTGVKRKCSTWMFGNDAKAEPTEFFTLLRLDDQFYRVKALLISRSFLCFHCATEVLLGGLGKTTYGYDMFLLLLQPQKST